MKSKDSEELYYIRCCISHEEYCLLWWKPESNGYTFDLDKAGLYTAEKAAEIQGNRDTDIPIAQSIAEAASFRVVSYDSLQEAKSALQENV